MTPNRDFSAGHIIGPLALTPGPADLFMFSAVTWNRHQIHYNKDRALAEGLPDVVVQRGLIGNYIARMLAAWLKGAGRIEALSWRVVKSAPVNRELVFQGIISSIESHSNGDILRCSVEGRLAGEIFATAEATLRLGR
ncbi:MAG: hypothetical protein AAB036_06615 [Elusimicrobiota bacterium]